MIGVAWIDWCPEWAPHVRGRYTERVWDPETKLHDPQTVEVRCTFGGCEATWRTTCQSGHVREHIATFARLHLHRDPLAAPTVVRPGSMRTTEIERREQERARR